MPPIAPGSLFYIVSGAQYCELSNGNTCVTDGSGNYHNNERCTVRALEDIVVTAVQYSVENYFDYISIGTHQYRSSSTCGAHCGPQNVYMPAQATLHDASASPHPAALAAGCGTSRARARRPSASVARTRQNTVPKCCTRAINASRIGPAA